MNQTPICQKSQIALSFSKAAKTYDTEAFLQKQAGYLLLEKLKLYAIEPKSIWDIGSGTGYFTKKIAEQHPQAQVTGIDIANGMVDYANQNQTHNNVTYLCTDADQLSCQQGKVDALFSNLMLQWSPNLSNTLKTFKTLLKPGAHLFFSTLGSKTLFELKEAWKTIDPSPHVHNFVSKEALILSLKKAGFEISFLQKETVRFYYDDLMALFLNLKALGAHNLQSNRTKGLMGKQTWIQLMNAYEKFRTNNQLPATYDVIYGVAK